MTTSERTYPSFTPESGTEVYGRARHPSALLGLLSARRPAPGVLEAAPRHHRVVQEHAAWRGHGGALLDGSAARKQVGLSAADHDRSEEHTSELQSLMRISYAVFCLKKKKKTLNHTNNTIHASSTLDEH